MTPEQLHDRKMLEKSKPNPDKLVLALIEENEKLREEAKDPTPFAHRYRLYPHPDTTPDQKKEFLKYWAHIRELLNEYALYDRPTFTVETVGLIHRQMDDRIAAEKEKVQLSGRLAVRVLRDASMRGYGCVDVRYAAIADNLLDSLSHIEEKNRAKWLEGWLKSFADREIAGMTILS